MFGQEKKKKTAAEIAAEGASNLSTFGKAATKSKDGEKTIQNIQKYAQAEADKKKAKKKTTVNTAPEDGFLTRMYKKYVSGSEKK
jgi:hypothetical protein